MLLQSETLRDSSRGTTRTGSSCDFIDSMHGSERFVCGLKWFPIASGGFGQEEFLCVEELG